jgi:predicted phosphoribosyltransferase
MPFRNRSEAGRRLAVALARYKEDEPAILALPAVELLSQRRSLRRSMRRST